MAGFIACMATASGGPDGPVAGSVLYSPTITLTGVALNPCGTVSAAQKPFCTSQVAPVAPEPPHPPARAPEMNIHNKAFVRFMGPSSKLLFVEPVELQWCKRPARRERAVADGRVERSVDVEDGGDGDGIYAEGVRGHALPGLAIGAAPQLAAGVAEIAP